MSSDLDTVTYMMAAEKIVNLIFTLENTMEFLSEYGVKADEEVKKVLTPLIKQLEGWTAK